MGVSYFDRYKSFRIDGEVKTLPFIKIPAKNTDERVVVKETTRFDKLSQTYYGNPYHGWLILQANPEFGGLEFDIPRDTVIIVPFPFRASIQDYQDAVNRYINLYGDGSEQ